MVAVHRWGRLLALIAVTAWTAACGDARGLQDRLYDEGSKLDAGKHDDERPGAAGNRSNPEPDAGPTQSPPEICEPAVSSDSLRARSDVMMHAGKNAPAGVFTSDLFSLFASNCGACHVDNSLGGFHVSLTAFTTVVTQEAYDRITSDEPKFFMPPTNRDPYSKLGPGSPLVELATSLKAWLDAGRPSDVFYPPTSTDSSNDPGRYLLSEKVGTQMTNLGNCIPPARMVHDAMKQDGDELDAMFKDATALPDRLEQTDMTTLDSEPLARQGVVAFAPAYTLWADNAKKVRMVRVPRGTSIEFDKESQSFEIPPNTRFYKTFFKRVIDIRGNESYRKMETRLIVSRTDTMNADGSVKQNALFGTYLWNDEETEATLLKDPLRNGEPFRDHLQQYVLDEQAADRVITTGPDDLQKSLSDAGLTRTYAVPGSERCIQCHMGSPTKSFILGFSPLQLARRKIGEGGVIEPAERDELNQLQRLIDYGVITGMASAEDVLPLEETEGDRKPRNDHELSAQGYMLGNCSHCHNPRGYPSTIAPELKDVLNFFPSDAGGIFQFPLEKFSPRIFRGTFQNVPQPYITPSLYDRPNGQPLPDTDVGAGDGSNYLPKILSYTNDPDTTYILAPWRSLIYRNIDTPFTYEEDFSIYPHMPMNTPGYDCRVRQLLGSWMVSIPARLKDDPMARVGAGTVELEATHHAAQPYVEVMPDDPEYNRMKRLGESRVTKFERGVRYTDCPDPTTVDIVDPAVVNGDRLVPQPLNRTITDEKGDVVAGYSLRVPERPHYAVTDLTNPPPPWFPRRPDWSTLIVDLDFKDVDNIILQQRIQMLHSVTISDALRALALTDVPFGTWQTKEECNLSSMPKVSEFNDARPRWMEVASPPADAPVYSISPGAEIFTQICSNCHGPQADSKGRLAATIADMTGGQTRVANLRDGFFGPTDDPGANRERIFGPVAQTAGDTAEVWAARYLMFMGLGGTQRTIPTPALQTIRNGAILGQKRPNPAGLDVSTANMLSVPLALCRAVLPGDPASFVLATGDLNYAAEAADKTPLIERNGDLELWQKLCAQDNEAVPVRVVFAGDRNNEYGVSSTLNGLRSASAYPSDASVGDPHGGVQIGIQPDNSAPWCLIRPTDSAKLDRVEQEWQAAHPSAGGPPYCPDAFLGPVDAPLNVYGEADIERWATRGAMNAGMAVFLYLEALATGDKTRPVPFDHCEQLPTP